MILEAVLDLYAARWGEPARTVNFQVGEFSGDIDKWSAETTPEGLNLYATVGGERSTDDRARSPASNGILHRAAGDGRGGEPSGCARALFSKEEVAVDHGHTVPADGPLWPGTQMRRFLVMRPLGDIIQQLTLGYGTHVELLQALPIFHSEFAFKTDQRRRSAAAAMGAVSGAFWDPNREPEPAVR